MWIVSDLIGAQIQVYIIFGFPAGNASAPQIVEHEAELVDHKLRVGIVGVGGIACTHLPGWEASEHAEVVAGCDIDASVINPWGKRHGIAKVTSDPDALFIDSKVDLIDICTPNVSHADLAIEALEAGKHVLCEKPLAPTPEAIRKIMDAEERSVGQLMTVQHYRFEGTSKALKTEIETGVLGDIYHARSWLLRRASMITRPSFTQQELSGGGACIDIGVHVLDLTLWFMGFPKATCVTGVARSELSKQEGAFLDNKVVIPPEMDVEEFAAAFVRFENGATLILEVSWLLHHDVPGEDPQIWLYGSRGGCRWPRCEMYETNTAARQHYNRSLKLTNEKLEAHALECVEFAQAIVDGVPSPVPASQSLQVLTILDGVYRSQASGREVKI